MAEAPQTTPSESTTGGARPYRRDDRRGLRALNRGTAMMGLMFLAGLGWVVWESSGRSTSTSRPPRPSRKRRS